MTRKMLLVLAHPDDESFGMGGTIAKYVAQGVEVHVAIATDGAAGSVEAEFVDRREQLVEIRTEELAQASRALGFKLHNLGYRDSGYINDPANEHPEAFINCDLDEAIGRVVKLIREIRPQVVVTHDETGGYFHPDHIQCWRITTPAFYAAGDASQYPDLGEPYQPERLYYTAFSNKWVKIFATMIRLRGGDPTKAGRNEDIDLTKLGVPDNKIHALIDYRPFWEQKRVASAAHASQGGGQGTRFGFLPLWLQKRFFGDETYMRAYPAVEDGFRERELFPEVTLAKQKSNKLAWVGALAVIGAVFWWQRQR